MTYSSSTMPSLPGGRKAFLQNPGIDVWEIGSAEAWVSAGYLASLYQRMTLRQIAEHAHVSIACTRGIVWLMRMWQGTAPRERWAAGCYVDPCVTPRDVSDWFDEPLHWAEQAYTRRRRLYSRWQHTKSLAEAAVGMFPDDPAPEQIRERCQEVLTTSDIPRERRVLTGAQFQRMWDKALLSRLAG